MTKRSVQIGLAVLAFTLIAGACDKIPLSQEQPTTPAASWDGPAR